VNAVDPRESAAAPIRALFVRYPHLGPVLPAVGYDAAQLEAARRFVAAGGRSAHVVALEEAAAVLAGRAGTEIRA
jgi:predicted GTPase